VIVTIIAVFGIKEYISLKNKIDEAKQGIQSDRHDAQGAIKEERKEFAKSTDEVADLVKRADVELSKMQATVSLIKDNQDYNDARLNRQLNDEKNASAEFHRKFGEFGAEFRSTQNKLKENSEDVADRLKTAEELLSKSKEVLTSVSVAQADVKTRFEKELVEPFGSLQKEVKTLKAKVLGSGSYIIKERMPGQRIQTVPEDANQDLEIAVGRLHISDLYDFRVTDGRGKVLFGKKDLKIGETIEFNTDEYKYRLTARYILRISFGSDAAGIDISWEPIDKPQSTASFNPTP